MGRGTTSSLLRRAALLAAATVALSTSVATAQSRADDAGGDEARASTPREELDVPAIETDDTDDAYDGGGRHRLELAVGGGLSWISDRPENVDVVFGGQLNARVMFDLVHVRADGWFLMPDPTRPDRFQLRADGRLLFVTVHDFTWRRSDTAGELLRLFAGLGGEIDLPEDVGHFMLNAGFAMIRSGGLEDVERPFDEAYGAYAGITLRLHFWELRDELRVAVHGMMRPPTIGLDFSVDRLFDGLEPGVTASNRLYLQALREGVVSLGPEVQAQVETLPAGVAFQWTLGVSGTLGL